MVRIEKLVVQGFKSFKRKTVVPFPAGFSAITGPNGSGKSCLGEAIAFVLGKSSSKPLRAKKSHELIFHGSKTKSPADYAQVILYLDNSNRKLPLKEKEVTVSRRINKAGVSTYRLNGSIATRQQVVDMLSQASIRPDGHNFIRQGDITRIVDMDPVQRRGIIDEISGIKEYDEKKEKSLKELQKIDVKVKEAEIILNEKVAIIDKLSKEREGAMMYRKLEADLDKIRASIIFKNYSSTSNKLDETALQHKEKTQTMSLLEKTIGDLDKKIIDQEKNLDELTREAVKASTNLDLTKEISRLRVEIDKKKNKLESDARETERLETMIQKLRSFDDSPLVKNLSGFSGVRGLLSDLIIVPRQYQIAAEVAAGSHLKDVVVDRMDTAVKSIHHLKNNKLGRARFLPLDKIQRPVKRDLPKGAIGWLSELVHHDPEFTPAVDFVFATTAAVKDIDVGKQIASLQRVRMVTLDGDLLESSGAITGGFYSRKPSTSALKSDIDEYFQNKKALEKEMDKLDDEIAVLQGKLDNLASKEKDTQSFSLEKKRMKIDEALTKFREERKESYEKRLILQQDTGKLNIEKAKLEAKFEGLKSEWDEYIKRMSGQPEKAIVEGLKPFAEKDMDTLRRVERDVIQQIASLGPINLKAVDDFDSLKGEFDEFREKVEKIMKEKLSIEDAIKRIEEKKSSVFNATLGDISKNFKEVYKELTRGEAELLLEDNDINGGLLIKAQPPGKKLLHIDNMSGGEKTLTAFTFVFAIQRHTPSPFYVLDEADAALDKQNTKLVANLIKKQARMAQFIIISHNDNLVREADQIYGVTMDDGESKVMGIKLPEEAGKNN